MRPDLPAWGVALLVAFPAFVRWWWGRPLAHQADDPVLPERLLAHNKRCGVVTGFAIALALFDAGQHAAWAIPGIYVANAAAAFPLRKALYEETWTFAAFLSFFGRLWLGFLGFWLLLISTPSLAYVGGRWYWFVALVLGGTLGAWSIFSAAVVRRLLRVQPIEDPNLLGRFDTLLARSTAVRPRFEYVAMRGGMLVNALALPAIRQPSVIFTDTLLSRFSENEIVAICAHELAHLEYYNPTRLRRLGAFTSLLVVAAVLIVPLAAIAGVGNWIYTLWVGVILIGLALRARRRQQHETDSDVRAVALTGDPEALADALTKLHQIARVPRRWAQQHEERATHPSLARRIRDIRASTGTAPAVLGAPATFQAANGSAAVTFHPAHLEWRDSGNTQSVEYSRLIDLRLNATPRGAVTLVSTDSEGRRRQMTPAPNDVRGLQSVLDVVDGQLRHERGRRPFSAVVTRLVAAFAVGLSWALSQGTLALAAALAAVVPAPALLYAAGAAGVAAALFAVMSGSDPDAWIGPALCVPLALCLLALGWARRRERPPATGVLVGCLACASAVATFAIGAHGISLVRLHQGARDAPAAFALLTALATAAWTYGRSRSWRYGAAGAALASIATFILATPFFLAHVARDPFQVAGPPPSTRPVSDKAVWESRVPFPVESLRVSPHGLLAAVVRSDEDDDAAQSARGPRGFQIVAAGRPATSLEADDLVFTSDARALVLRARSGDAELSEIDLESKSPVWRQSLGDVRGASVWYHDATKTWSVDGRDSGRRPVRITGTAGRSDVVRRLGPSDPPGASWVEAWASGAAGILTLHRRTVRGPMQPRQLPRSLSGLYSLFRPRSSFTLSQSPSNAARPPVESALDTSCVNDALEGGRFVCAAFDGDRTHVLGYDPDSGSIVPLTTIDGHMWLESATEPGWIVGMWDGTPTVLHVATRELIFPAADDDALTIAANDAVLATAGYGTRASTVRVYRRKPIAD